MCFLGSGLTSFAQNNYVEIHLFFFFKVQHLFKNLFIYLFSVALGLRCCTQAFPSCSEPGPILH